MPRLALAVLGALCAAAAADDSIVQTQFGALQGSINGTVRSFRGIPYATPPVGGLRWQSPRPYSGNWTGIRDATQDSAGCMQHCFQPPLVCPPVMSEDCLYLNIFTPVSAKISQPLPVYIYMHGGDFKDGYGGGPLYDGTELVEKANMVVVPMNYRLGALGFLFTGNDTNADPWAVQGNYGIQDQRQAMRWVIDNIAAFGGDPSRIIIGGQSAGSMSVASHLMSPLSQGLFHAGVMHSLPFSMPWRTQDSGADFGKAYAHHANCTDVLGFPVAPYKTATECLRSLSSEALVAAQVATQNDLLDEISRIIELFLPWSPIIGTYEIPEMPVTAFQNGRVADVPLIVGTTQQEAVVFVYEAMKKNMSALTYYLILDVIFGLENGGKVAKQYPLPAPAPSDARAYASQVGTSSLFRCSTLNATLSLSGTGRKSPIFLYRYNHVMSFSPAMWGPNFTCCADAVCHGSDLTAIFHPDDGARTPYIPAESAMSADIQTWIGNLAWQGDVNQGTNNGQPFWPALDASQPITMVWETPQRTPVSNLDTQECQMWNEIGFNFY